MREHDPGQPTSAVHKQCFAERETVKFVDAVWWFFGALAMRISDQGAPIEAGDSLDTFLHSFPSVTREQAVAVLELAREALAPDAHPA